LTTTPTTSRFSQRFDSNGSVCPKICKLWFQTSNSSRKNH